MGSLRGFFNLSIFNLYNNTLIRFFDFFPNPYRGESKVMSVFFWRHFPYYGPYDVNYIIANLFLTDTAYRRHSKYHNF